METAHIAQTTSDHLDAPNDAWNGPKEIKYLKLARVQADFKIVDIYVLSTSLARVCRIISSLFGNFFNGKRANKGQRFADKFSKLRLQ